MLVNYRFSNFRSFYKDTVFSLKAGVQTSLNENLIREFDLRLLPSAVIYGPNASGKSNLIMSLEVMRDIILSGSPSANLPSLKNLELCPFVHYDAKTPMNFEADFINGGKRFLYSFSIQVNFLKREERKIIFESLSVIDKKDKKTLIYARDENGVKLERDRKTLNLLEFEDKLLNVFEKKINDNFDDSELFLSRAFKSTINNDLADLVIDFFKERLLVVSDFTLKKTNLTYTMTEQPAHDFVFLNKALETFASGADLGPQKRIFRPTQSEGKNSQNLELFSVYHHEDHDIMIPAELMESRGTLKLIDFAIPFGKLFTSGGVFMLDEFDSAIHPEIIKGIISLFNNQELNKAGAQLIFTTHNPIYLNNSIFRRDQIFFVEKDSETYESAIYSLSDFGSKEVRNDHNYLLNYFKGNYGALPSVDFSKVLNQLCEE